MITKWLYFSDVTLVYDDKNRSIDFGDVTLVYDDATSPENDIKSWNTSQENYWKSHNLYWKLLKNHATSPENCRKLHQLTE